MYSFYTFNDDETNIWKIEFCSDQRPEVVVIGTSSAGICWFHAFPPDAEGIGIPLAGHELDGIRWQWMEAFH